ncbi:double-stranded RNA-binding protein 1-like isoform X1 [Argentina anserina]|uniref:double-stranded RNA-binding protein 1-like isoform X1 n=1 Tax=Argentina anserina TaxID=57926 RepID=UPI0021761F9F|nr:double-stranded RNA-binding protein 1-like isoform X1 [Potentilla anserina]XP_050378683.1 double-stranded RNA-binding protein 1-like isoform X1 [Potentilla anserina]XP_050378684.1 double-stranded RNA-binding protein 1-like isoform X1 [Potentilla anserina]
MATDEELQGLSKCYVFKSRLQEYAQKAGIKTPVYETTKEGPSHEPSFCSTVIVNDVRYNSLLGFTHRKAAEQSAAEVALLELSKSSDAVQCISQPVHEIGLCKNLLQEYAQKMNYAVPVYQCQKDTSPGKASVYSCTVEIGGIRYIGAAAATKKEAEIKVARTALLALQLSDTKSSMGSVGTSELTVLPSRKRRSESEETDIKPKRKKVPYRRRTFKRKPSEEIVAEELESDGNVKPMSAESMPQDSVSDDIPHANNVYVEYGPSTASDLTNCRNGSGDLGSVLSPNGNITNLAEEVNMVSALEPMTAEAMLQDSVSKDIAPSAEHGSSTTKEVYMVSAVKPVTAEGVPQESVSSEIPQSKNVNAKQRSQTAKELNMVSVVEQMTAENMPQDSLSKHIPHANNVNAEHGSSTMTSDFTNATNGNCDVVGSVSVSCENTATSANKGNLVSAGPSEVSTVIPGPDQSR